MKEIITVGPDIDKHVFQVHGVDRPIGTGQLSDEDIVGENRTLYPCCFNGG